MSLNGTALGTHAYMQREPQDVDSFLLFGDIGAGAGVLNRCLSLLDVSYPKATKAGLVVTRVGNEPPLVVGYRGKLLEKGCGLLGLALPSPLHSSIGLCGCRAVGVPLEVHDADLQQTFGAFIRTVGSAKWDHESWGVPGVIETEEAPMPPRRQSIPAATALKDAAAAAGYGEDVDFWIGVPRKLRIDERNFRVAPGAGEWALYQWATTTAEGTVVLEGGGPRADGFGKKGVRKVQAFVSRPDYGTIGRLAQSYDLERLTSPPSGAPQARLLLAGGPGAVASVADETLFDGCALGLAVIGNAGLTLARNKTMEGKGSFSYANQRPTMIHRQAAGLLVIHA